MSTKPNDSIWGRTGTGREKATAASGGPLPLVPRGRQSSIELHRMRLIVTPDYDLTDPYELAAFRAVQDRMDALEELLIRSEMLRREEPDAQGFANQLDPAPEILRPSPAEFERMVLRLLTWYRRLSPLLEGRTLFARGKEVAAVLFRERYGDELVIPTSAWEAGGSFARAVVREGGSGAEPHRGVGEYGRLAPLTAVLRWSFGDLVSQSGAARMLGITDKSLRDTLHTRNLPFVRVGYRVMISREAIEEASHLRLQRQRQKHLSGSVATADAADALDADDSLVPAAEEPFDVDVQAAARFLGLSGSTVRRMSREGRLPSERDVTGTYFRQTDLRAYRDDHLLASGAEQSEDVYTMEEAARYLGWSVHKVKMLVRARKLVPLLGGRRYYFTRARLDDLRVEREGNKRKR